MKRIMTTAVLIILPALLLSAQTLNVTEASSIIDPAPVVNGVNDLAGIWEDRETHSLHTIIRTEKGYNVESIIEYGSENNEISKVNLVLSEWKDGRLKWGYYVPSTGYYVFFAAVSANTDRLLINWANNDGKGNTRKGKEILRRIMTDDLIEDTSSDSETAVAKSQLCGKIYKITGKEIIIASKNAGDVLKIGDKLFIIIDGQKVYLDVTFPMQTVAKCRLNPRSAKYKNRINVNTPVYK